MGSITSPMDSGAVLRTDPCAPAPEPAVATPPACRICWGAADAEQGGKLLAPCRCRGTLSHVHLRCLCQWTACQHRTGRRGAGNRCEICGHIYNIPDLLQSAAWRDGSGRVPGPRANLLRWLSAARNTPAGRIYSLACALWGMAGCVAGATVSVVRMPALFWEARSNPRALGALASELGMGTAVFSLVGLEPAFYVQAVVYYGMGYALDASCSRLAHSLQAAKLPLSLGATLPALLWAPRLAAWVLEAFHLALLSFVGGLGAGFIRGVWKFVRLPFKCVLLPKLLRASGNLAASAWSMGARL